MKKCLVVITALLLLAAAPAPALANAQLSHITGTNVTDVLLVSENNVTLGTVIGKQADHNIIVWTLSVATDMADSGYFYYKDIYGNWTRGVMIVGLRDLGGGIPGNNQPGGNAPPWDDNAHRGRTGTFDVSQLHGWRSGYGYQYVQFGRYRQDYADQPILWRILGIQNGRALLLSEYILDTLPFDADSNAWECSDLKAWLNGTFYWCAFSQTERYAIQYNGSVGRVFIPSDAELCKAEYGFQTNKYFKDPNRSAEGTAYAYSHNLWHPNSGSHSNYFARSNPNSTNVDLIASSGKMVLAKITRDNVGVRPAVWVDINWLPLSGGAGTMRDPFR